MATRLDVLLDEIDNASKAELHYAALMLALSVPDVCAALQSSNGESTGALYQAWVNQNLQHYTSDLSALDFWKLRCGIFHQSRTKHSSQSYDRLIFSIPSKNRPTLNLNIVEYNGVYVLEVNAGVLCRDMIAAARAWYTANQNHPYVLQNIGSLLQYYPNGIPNVIVGFPLFG